MLTIALFLTSCGGGGGSGPSSPPPSTPSANASRPVSQSDLEIASSVYKGDARTPAGFYAESIVPGRAYVSTAHLKNSDVDGSLTSAHPVYELCSDDWNQALAWSEASAHNNPVYSDLVETNDDARFHEFGRVRSGDPEFYLRARVYKCSYLDRAGVNLQAASGPAGNLKQRPLTPDDLQRLSEYLWQFTPYNNYGNVVLKSSGASTTTNLSHTLHIAQLQRGALSASCDRIDVLAWRHTVEATTGALELQVQTLWSFGARETAGVAELCSG